MGEAGSWCGRSPERCFADAARLTALVSASGEDAADVSLAEDIAYPLPSPDPRRHAPPRELTPAR